MDRSSGRVSGVLHHRLRHLAQETEGIDGGDGQGAHAAGGALAAAELDLGQYRRE